MRLEPFEANFPKTHEQYKGYCHELDKFRDEFLAVPEERLMEIILFNNFEVLLVLGVVDQTSFQLTSQFSQWDFCVKFLLMKSQNFFVVCKITKWISYIYEFHGVHLITRWLAKVWDSRTTALKSNHMSKLSNMRNNQTFDMITWWRNELWVLSFCTKHLFNTRQQRPQQI